MAAEDSGLVVDGGNSVSVEVMITTVIKVMMTTGVVMIVMMVAEVVDWDQISLGRRFGTNRPWDLIAVYIFVYKLPLAKNKSNIKE